MSAPSPLTTPETLATARIREHFNAALIAQEAAFRNLNEKQAAVVPPAFARVLKWRERGEVGLGARRPTLGAFAVSELYKSHHLYLSNAPASGERLAVVSMLRSTLEIMGLDQCADPDVQLGLGADIADSCVHAETYFDGARKQADTLQWGGGHRKHRDLTVYQDSQGRPLLFQKTNIAPTALTLVNCLAGDVPVPAGTIVGCPPYDSITPQDGRRSLKQGNSVSEGFTLHVRTIGDGLDDSIPPVAVRPLRLSAWAFDDAADRELFGVSGDSWYQEGTGLPQPFIALDRSERCAAVTLGDFRAAAERIVEVVSREGQQ